MDPQAYCEATAAELLSLRARRGSDPELLQRLVVLAYFAERPLAEEEFTRELRELSGGAHGRPGVTAAARAILADWQERAAVADAASSHRAPVV